MACMRDEAMGLVAYRVMAEHFPACFSWKNLKQRFSRVHSLVFSQYSDDQTEVRNIK